MYKNKNGFSPKVFLILGQNSICRNSKPTSRTTTSRTTPSLKKSVVNKFSLFQPKHFSLATEKNLKKIHRDFQSILLFICHGLKKKTLRLTSVGKVTSAV